MREREQRVFLDRGVLLVFVAVLAACFLLPGVVIAGEKGTYVQSIDKSVKGADLGECSAKLNSYIRYEYTKEFLKQRADYSVEPASAWVSVCDSPTITLTSPDSVTHAFSDDPAVSAVSVEVFVTNGRTKRIRKGCWQVDSKSKKKYAHVVAKIDANVYTVIRTRYCKTLYARSRDSRYYITEVLDRGPVGTLTVPDESTLTYHLEYSNSNP